MVWLAVWIVVFAASAVGVVVSANSVRFQRNIAREVRTLWSVEPAPSGVIPEAAPMPPPVQRYLQTAAGESATTVSLVRLRHGGTFRTAPGQPWLTIRGQQFFKTDPPGFVWWGRVRVAPVLWIDARDESMQGVGRMLVKAGASWTLADARGPQIDQGALLRMLGEMTWFPTAFADSRYLSWTALDERSAEATFRVADREVHAVFQFGADGLPTRFTAMRYRDVGNGRSRLTPFVGMYSDFREQDGLLVPFEVEAAWELDDGLFPYARFVVERLEFNPSAATAD